MKWSNFVYYVELGNKIRLKSTKTNSVIELDKEKFNYLNGNLAKFNYINENNDFIELEQLGFLVEDLNSEKKEFYEDLLSSVTNLESEFVLTITPTLRCNFKCSYCYENGIDRKKDLDFETIDKMFVWIKEFLIQKNNISNIHFKIFGGEPLFAHKTILKYLFDKIKNVPINFTSGIITNGYLLNEEICKELNDINLQYMQITLDGTEQYHNIHKTLLNGRGTYDKILKNLKFAIDNGTSNTYVIRSNCCKNNLNEVDNLIRSIGKEFQNYKDKIIFSLGMIGGGNDSDFNNSLKTKELNIIDGSLEKYAYLYKIVKDEGFFSPDYYAYSGLCSFKVTDSAVFDPEGNILKCLRGMGQKSFYESNVSNIEIIKRNPNIELYDQCFDEKCPFIPYCHLGCQHDLYVKNRITPGRNCKRKELEYINSELLRIMY